MSPLDDAAEQQLILRYWFGKDLFDPASVKSREKIWYSGTKEVDNEIREQFGALFERACDETLLHWCESGAGSLALVILLDQFSRNLHRGSSEAFTQDPLARAVAKRAINAGFDKEVSPIGRIFLLHPFHHSESLLDQDFACIKLSELNDEGHEEWQSWLDTTHNWFRGHREIVQRFSRFPHRNTTLGRQSTEEEERFLTESGSFGQ